MDFTALLVSMGSMGGMGALFAAGLSIANKKLHVDEDPRIEQVNELLPGANCGGCGYPGCANFAENVVKGTVDVTECGVSSPEDIEEIAAILGIDAEAGEKEIARVMCQGGTYETAKKAEYAGIESCVAVNISGGGEKYCEYGCLGYGECIDACTFDAMYMSDNGLPVVIEDKCTGCGKCAEACPRDVIEMHPASDKLFVLCKNHDDPKTSRGLCIRACIGCQICVRAVEDGQMVMDDNLAIVDYNLYGKDAELPTDRCPTECLVVLNGQEETEEVLEKTAA